MHVAWHVTWHVTALSQLASAGALGLRRADQTEVREIGIHSGRILAVKWCPTSQACLALPTQELCPWPLRLVKLTSRPHSGFKHHLHFPPGHSQHLFIRPSLLPYRPVSEPWKLLVDREHGSGFWLLPGAEDPTCLAPPQESPRVLSFCRHPSPKMEGRPKVPCRLQRDKDSCLQGVSQLPAALISRAQSSAWEPSPCNRPPSPASSPDGSFCPVHNV